jgi:intracellular septation protein A
MAKVLAIMFATLSLFSFVAALVMHTQIVANLSNTVISAAVVVYLFGSATLSEHAQRYIMQIRSRSTSPDWKRFD